MPDQNQSELERANEFAEGLAGELRAKAADQAPDVREAPRGKLPADVEQAAARIHSRVWGTRYTPGEGPMHHAGGDYWRGELLRRADQWESEARDARLCAGALPGDQPIPASSSLPDSGERWTIHVCPHCSALCASDDWDDAPCDCPDDGDILTVLVAPVSSSAGDEAREALAMEVWVCDGCGYNYSPGIEHYRRSADGNTELCPGSSEKKVMVPLGEQGSAADALALTMRRSLSQMDELRDAHAALDEAGAPGRSWSTGRRIRALLASLSSPLQGAGDGRAGELTREEIEDHLDRARALVLRVRKQPMYDDLAEALDDVDDALAVALNELWDSDQAPAPADEETTR